MTTTITTESSFATTESSFAITTRSYDTDNVWPRFAVHSTGPDDQAWYWTAEWQAGEALADRDREAGRIIHLTLGDIQKRIDGLHNAGESP